MYLFVMWLCLPEGVNLLVCISELILRRISCLTVCPLRVCVWEAFVNDPMLCRYPKHPGDTVLYNGTYTYVGLFLCLLADILKAFAEDDTANNLVRMPPIGKAERYFLSQLVSSSGSPQREVDGETMHITLIVVVPCGTSWPPYLYNLQALFMQMSYKG